MAQTRRNALLSLLLVPAAGGLAQEVPEPGVPRPRTRNEEEERRLPDGKSQTNAIAKQQHEDALKDADRLVALAKEIQEDLQKSGNYVVSVSTLKKTEEVEKLARKIRSRLKT